MNIQLIEPDWPAPEHVRAISTTRGGGVSKSAYASFNLATHVGDDASCVQQNRERLMQQAQLPAEPYWLQQCHGNTVSPVRNDGISVEADASISQQAGQVCAVLTADCLPVLICDTAGSQIAAVHAGWKGLHAGIITAAIQQFQCAPQQLLVWLGPAIGPGQFEVGREVFIAFTERRSQNAQAFSQTNADRWLCDLYLLAKLELNSHSVNKIFGGDYCTYSDTERFFSYRRNKHTGRMASMIWLQP